MADINTLKKGLIVTAFWEAKPGEVETLTGLTLDGSGSIQILDNAAWLRGRERVKQQGGPPMARSVR